MWPVAAEGSVHSRDTEPNESLSNDDFFRTERALQQPAPTEPPPKGVFFRPERALQQPALLELRDEPMRRRDGQAQRRSDVGDGLGTCCRDHRAQYREGTIHRLFVIAALLLTHALVSHLDSFP